MGTSDGKMLLVSHYCIMLLFLYGTVQQKYTKIQQGFIQNVGNPGKSFLSNKLNTYAIYNEILE